MKNTKFSLILKQTRENAGLTQKQVAQALGIERSTYAYYETGTSHPNAMMVLKLAAIFNVNYMIFMDAIGDLSFDNSPENPQFTTLHDSSALDREKVIFPVRRSHTALYGWLFHSASRAFAVNVVRILPEPGMPFPARKRSVSILREPKNSLAAPE